ncbi:hypothetical protein DERF_003747, partial [Dermatophagoides farinae]
ITYFSAVVNIMRMTMTMMMMIMIKNQIVIISRRRRRRQQQQQQQQKRRRIKSKSRMNRTRKHRRRNEDISDDDSLSSVDDSSLNLSNKRNNVVVKRERKQTTTKTTKRHENHHQSNNVRNDNESNGQNKDVDDMLNVVNSKIMANNDKQTSFDEQQQRPQQQQQQQKQSIFPNNQMADVQSRPINIGSSKSPTPEPSMKNHRRDEEFCEHAYIVYNPRLNTIALSRTLNELVRPDSTIIYKVDETSNNEDKIRIKSRNNNGSIDESKKKSAISKSLRSDYFIVNSNLLLKDCQNDDAGGEHIKSSLSLTMTDNIMPDQKKPLAMVATKNDDTNETVHVNDQTVFVYSTKVPTSLKNQWTTTTSTIPTKSISSKRSIVVEERAKHGYSFEKNSKNSRSSSGHERSSSRESSEDSDGNDDDVLFVRQRNRYHRSLSRKLKSSRIGHQKRKSMKHDRRLKSTYINKKRRKSNREKRRKR